MYALYIYIYIYAYMYAYTTALKLSHRSNEPNIKPSVDESAVAGCLLDFVAIGGRVRARQSGEPAPLCVISLSLYTHIYIYISIYK